MTPLDAVAAAIRERLIAGRPAPLPGLGTLVRQHVSARVEERADGSRVLLPPGETIGLAPAGADQESLAEAFGRLRALAPEASARGYTEAMDQIEARLAATGEVRLPGVGLLRRTSGGVVLGVEADLLAAVNRTYEGLVPVATAPSAARERAADEPAADEPAADDLTEDESASAAPDSEPESAAASATAGDVLASASAENAPVAPVPPFAPVSEGSPLRDLSPDPGSPFDPPAPSDAEVASAEVASADAAGAEAESAGADVAETDLDSEADLDAESQAAGNPLVGDETTPEETEVSDQTESAAESGPAQIADIEPPADPLFAFPPPAYDPDLSPTDVSFVDDDTLDADLDDVLLSPDPGGVAVPFGGGASLGAVLPPTPQERAPEPDAPASAPALDDEWAEHTWTAPSSDPPPSFGDEAFGDEIEDAEIVDDEMVAGPEAGAPRENAQSPAGPSDEWDALLGEAPEAAVPLAAAGPLLDNPPALPAEPAVVLPVSDESGPQTEVVAAAPPPDASRGGIPWWLVALALALVAALALWLLWSRLVPSRDAEPTITVERASPVLVPAATADPAAEPDSLVPPDAPPAAGGATPPAGAQTSPAGLPPLVAGLPAPDARALAGPEPVRAGADAWTLVVLSTPSREAADALHAQFQQAGYRTSVLASDRGARTMYRLAVGQFESRDDAIRLRDRLSPLAPAETWALDLRTL